MQTASRAEMERVGRLADFQTVNAREEVAALERTVAALHARRQADAATDGEEARRAQEAAAAQTEALRLKLEAAQRQASEGAAAKAAAAQVFAELKAAEWRCAQEVEAVRATAAAEAEAALRTHAVQHAALSEEIKSVKSELKLALVQVSVGPTRHSPQWNGHVPMQYIHACPHACIHACPHACIVRA